MKHLPCLVFSIAGAFLVGTQSKSYPDKELFKDPYEFKMISSGDNRPPLNVMKDSLYVVLTLLHQGYSEATIARYLKWSPVEFDAHKNKLLENNFLRNRGGRLRPNTMIISLGEGQHMRQQLAPMVAAATHLIKGKLPLIQQRYQQIPAFRTRPFAESSLLILSDVLLDNWQIGAIETAFLTKERPLRHGKRYYAALMQKHANSPVEALGIYGNNVTARTGYAVCRYGNVRYTPAALQQAQVVEQAYQRYKASSASEAFAYPVLSPTDEAALAELAGLVLPDLLALSLFRVSALKVFYAGAGQ